MKKFFKYLGFAIICGVSFFYTEKTANVVKELDEIMIKINEVSKNNRIEAVEAEIIGKGIIPGVNGYEIDINNSYRKMRYIGSYNENYLEYKDILVKNRLIDNLDKFIVSGNRKNNNASLVFIIENNTNIDTLLNILKINKVEGTMLISGLWLEKNNDLLYSIIKDNHSVGSISYNYDYENISYPWVDNIIKKVSKSKNSYCINANEKALEICSKYKNYTLHNDVITKDFLINTKNKLTNGSILIYKVNSSLEEELDLIIKYIMTRGIDIVNVNKLLQE